MARPLIDFSPPSRETGRRLETRNRKLETVSVPIASLTLELRIEHAQSLKDKRQVVRSLKDKLRVSFNVSVSELEPESQGIWNQASIGVAAISDSRDYLAGLMQKVERAAVRIANNAGADVTDSYLEIL